MVDGRVFEAMASRWDRWATSADGARTRRRWAQQRATLDGWAVDELRSPRSSQRTDAMQAALVALAQAGDQQAAATVINQLRPGLTALARRVAATDPRFGTFNDAAAEVLSAFGERLMHHRLDRRPRKIAANLLLDTRQQIWRAGTREARIADAALTEAAVATGAEPTSTSRPEAIVAELAVVGALASALDGLGGSVRSRRVTAELAYRAWILDEPSGAIARDLGLGREAVSSRLCRLRAGVRAQLDQ